MAGPPDPRPHFDRWAETYDEDVAGQRGFPFTGYRRALALVLSRAEGRAGMSVLDLGTGTGALGGMFLAHGCSVWGTDFSSAMIRRARAKHPGLRLAEAALDADLPASFPARFHRIVSAYALHHLALPAKVGLMKGLVRDRLRPSGRLIVADVSFPTVRDRAEAAARRRDLWDPSEHYWAADETTRALLGVGLDADYTQVSPCAGVYVVEPGRGGAGAPP